MVPVNPGRRRVPVNRNVCYESTCLPQDHPDKTLGILSQESRKRSTESRKGVAVSFPVCFPSVYLPSRGGANPKALSSWKLTIASRLHWPGVAIASPVGTLVGSPLVGPEAQWPPWGGNTLSRGVAGGVVHISPPVPPRLVLPRMAPPDARGPLEVLVGIVLGELDSSTPRVSKTIEIYPDKKKGVGSLRTPRECDGRLPPDAGYYLDLVIPRFGEPPKKITCLFE